MRNTPTEIPTIDLAKVLGGCGKKSAPPPCRPCCGGSGGGGGPDVDVTVSTGGAQAPA